MPITIDWTSKVIYVPKADLTLMQVSPLEIRELNIDWFRYQLKALEYSEEGMWADDTHKHNTEVSLGGLTFARVVELINDYTVTFEDGNYAVNLVGANSNIGDKVNVNQVSVRSYNSAGLISSPAIEYASYGDGVSIDVNSSFSGTIYPVGTLQKPVNNLSDAVIIANSRGFNNLYFLSDFTFTAGTVITNFNFRGRGLQQTLLTFELGSVTANCSCFDAKVTGRSFGVTYLENCYHYNYGGGDLMPSNRTVVNKGCVFEGESYIPSRYTGNLFVIDCWSAGADESDAPVVNMNGAACSIINRNYNGATKLSNCSSPDAKMSYDFNSGILILSDTVISGSMDVRGTGKLINNSKVAFNLDYEGLMSKDTISTSVWDEDISTYTTHGTAASVISGIDLVVDKLPNNGIAGSGEYNDILSRAVGLLQENQHMDNMVYINYNGQKLLSSGRIRTYSNSSSVGTANDIVATYVINVSWLGDEMQTYEVKRL